MSGVYQRNREVSEYKFFTQAIAIRVEVNKLMASSSVVPKAYRLLNAVPTVETARGPSFLGVHRRHPARLSVWLWQPLEVWP